MIKRLPGIATLRWTFRGSVLAAMLAASGLAWWQSPVARADPQAAPAATVAPPTRPLPTLPLVQGTRIVGLGHSFIQRGGYSGRGSGPNGVDYLARGVLSQVRNLAPHLAIDYFAATVPWPGQSGANSLTGSMQGIGGDHLLAIGRAPGTINRMAYALAGRPGIVYLDIGGNDIASGVGGPWGSDGSAKAVIAALDRQIAMLTQAGVWVVVQTVAWRDWSPGRPDDPRYAVTDAVNAWIAAQAKRPGVRVCNTIAIDGTAKRDAAAFAPDGIHPNALAASRRAAVLLPILLGLVAPPKAEPPRTAATLAAVLNTGLRVTGTVAAGWTAEITTGNSHAEASFVTAADGSQRETFTVTPSPDGTGIHELRFKTTDIPLSELRAAPGEWLEIKVPFEIDGWAGWRLVDAGGAGPLSLNNELASKKAIVFEANDKSAYPQPRRQSTIGVLRALLWLHTDDAQAVLRWSSRPLVIRFDSNAKGTGKISVGLPAVRRIYDPRKAWRL